jgi:hypothetical protein
MEDAAWPCCAVGRLRPVTGTPANAPGCRRLYSSSLASGPVGHCRCAAGHRGTRISVFLMACLAALAGAGSPIKWPRDEICGLDEVVTRRGRPTSSLPDRQCRTGRAGSRAWLRRALRPGLTWYVHADGCGCAEVTPRRRLLTGGCGQYCLAGGVRTAQCRAGPAWASASRAPRCRCCRCSRGVRSGFRHRGS